MNLNTPPPVEELDPDFATQIRTDLVTKARKSQRQRSKWVPALAAACGIAVITTGVVVLAQPGDDSGGIGPAGQTPAPTAKATVQNVPPGDSKVVSLDLGPASPAEAKAAARKCLAQSIDRWNAASNPAKPGDADTATVHQARWIKVVPGSGAVSAPSRTLLQTFTTAKGVWMECLDSELVIMFDPATMKNRQTTFNINAADVVNGGPTITEGKSDGKPQLWVDYSFIAMPVVARLEIRIRWTGGASPWYGVAVVDGVGYLTAVQQGATSRRGEMEIDIRAFDAKGNEVYGGTEYG